MKKFSYQEVKELGYYSYIEMMVTKLNEAEIKPRDYHKFLFNDRDPDSSFMGGICTSYQAIKYLKEIGLLNNGVCPMCGNAPIDSKYHFTSGFNQNINFHICKRCYGAGTEISINSKSDRAGCYIATTCYGSYESVEVKEFRRYRDEKLSKKWIGRKFISLYYLISPSFAEWLKDKYSLNNWIRVNILDKIYRRIK